MQRRAAMVAVGVGHWMAFQLLVLTVYPTLIAPLFNNFPPLEDPELKQRIEALLARCGFTARACS